MKNKTGLSAWVANAAGGNYILFSGITSDNFILRTEERNFRASINGLQIVAVIPEPSTLGLFRMLLVLPFLLLLRRRR